nr:protein NYNRIN-like [Tanacetum cinerariifolium]
MLAIFHDMIEKSIEVFMDDFSVFGNSFDNCLNNLDKMLQRCKDANLVLSWEKCHFMVKEGIVLGQKVSGAGLEVDKAKINVIFKLPSPTNVIGIRSFLDHSALIHLFKEQDVKPRLIRWILLLQEFNIEIKDKKGTNVANDHLSRIENDETSDNNEIDDNFLGETLMEISTRDIPWIPLLYRGEYSQWVERFMNYLEEQTDGKAMINSIKNGDQPLPHVTQVSIAGTSSTEQPPLKDKSMWTSTVVVTSDPLALIAEKTNVSRSKEKVVVSSYSEGSEAYDFSELKRITWDALARHMLGFEYVINDLKKCGYSKDNCELNFKFLNNLQPEWKQYATMMRQNKNLMDINIDALYNILKQNQGDVNDAMGSKKKTVVVTSDPLALIAEKTNSANKKQEFVKTDNKKVEKKDDEKKRDMSRVKCYNCKKEGHFAKDCKKDKVNYYEYYKTKMLLAKKDKDEQVLLAEDQAWMESSKASSSSVDEKISEINANMVFMDQIEKVLSDSEASSSSVDEKISEVLKDQLQVKHVVIDTDVECQEKYAKFEAVVIVEEPKRTLTT